MTSKWDPNWRGLRLHPCFNLFERKMGCPDTTYGTGDCRPRPPKIPPLAVKLGSPRWQSQTHRVLGCLEPRKHSPKDLRARCCAAGPSAQHLQDNGKLRILLSMREHPEDRDGDPAMCSVRCSGVRLPEFVSSFWECGCRSSGHIHPGFQNSQIEI